MTHTPAALRLLLALGLLALLSACTLPAATGPASPPPAALPPTSTPPPAPTATPTPTPTPAPTHIPLDERPLVFFAPLPPLGTHPGRPFIGSEDFMAPFDPNAPWRQAAEGVHLFKFYQEWVGSDIPDKILHQAVADLNRRGIALALEAAPLDADGCGAEVEGFAGVANAVAAMRRLQAAGGDLRVIALDEPYYYAHIYDGPNACRWEPEMIAAEVQEFIDAARAVFPNVIVGDTEPITSEALAEDYIAWLDAFRAVNGYDLPFLHLDMSYDLPDWVAQVQALEAYGDRQGIELGIIYMGQGEAASSEPAASDEAWLTAAGERIKRYELDNHGRPDHVLFQSWNDKPDFVLPETDPYTWTGLIRIYGEDKAGLGVRTEGPGAYLSYRKPLNVSNALPDMPAANAVDGDPATLWNSGGDAPQFIEIDLGAEYSVAEIRLLVSQFPPGETVHELWINGGATGGNYILQHTFQGQTEDSRQLTYRPDAPLAGVRLVMLRTKLSPSWVAWREIQVIAAE